MREERFLEVPQQTHFVSYCLHLDHMLVLNKFLERGHHDWQMEYKIHSEAGKRVPPATFGGKILR